MYVLNKLDAIYKKQLSFHQAQLNRYAKAAELRRMSGRHQNQINKMGNKWKETIDKGLCRQHITYKITYKITYILNYVYFCM